MAPLCQRTALAALIVGCWLLAGSAGVEAGGFCRTGVVSEAAGVRVDVRGNCYAPGVLHATAGETVTWVNHDPDPHTVSGANAAWGSYEQLDPGEEISVDFDTPGTYVYWCFVHPGMIGAIVVDGDSRDTQPTAEAASTTGAGIPMLPAWLLAAFIAGSTTVLGASRVRRQGPRQRR